MAISVSCSCGAKFAAKDALAGKTVKCPKCSQPIRITATREVESTPATDVTQKRKSSSQPAKPADESVGSLLDELGVAAPVKHDIACPKCGAGMKEGAILCIACGFNTKSGKQLASSSDGVALAKREEYYAKQAAKAESQQAKMLKSGGGKAAAASSSSTERYSSDASGKLGVLDIVVCVLCAGIGLIVSIVYLVTGNPKGSKMLVISLGAIVFWNVLGFVLGMLIGPQQ